MKTYKPINVSDVNEFLYKHGIVLEDKVSVADINSHSINANVEIYKNKEMDNTQIYIDVDDVVFNCCISYPYKNSRYQFETKTFDLSLDWVKFRCSKYPENAPHIKLMAETMAQQRQEDTENQIRLLKQQIDNITERSKAELLFWNKCIKIAKQTGAAEGEKQPGSY